MGSCNLAVHALKEPKIIEPNNLDPKLIYFLNSELHKINKAVIDLFQNFKLKKLLIISNRINVFHAIKCVTPKFILEKILHLTILFICL